MTGHDPFDLARFVNAQNSGSTAETPGGVYDRAVAELRAGAKVSHWMWFVFPQISGLGLSPTAVRYAITGLPEARAYLAHPVLGARLEECAAAVLAVRGRTAEDILGPVDAAKLRSSMTLFAYAGPDREVFRAVLRRYFDGREDNATTSRLAPDVPEDVTPGDAEED